MFSVYPLFIQAQLLCHFSRRFSLHGARWVDKTSTSDGTRLRAAVKHPESELLFGKLEAWLEGGAWNPIRMRESSAICRSVG